MACIVQGSDPDKSMNYFQIWQLFLVVVHLIQLWNIQNYRLPSNILDVLNQNLQEWGLHMYILQIYKMSFILKAENMYHYN